MSEPVLLTVGRLFSVTVVLGSVDAELIEYLWPALAVA